MCRNQINLSIEIRWQSKYQREQKFKPKAGSMQSTRLPLIAKPLYLLTISED